MFNYEFGAINLLIRNTFTCLALQDRLVSEAERLIPRGDPALVIRNSNGGTIVQPIGLVRPSTPTEQARLRPAQIIARASSKRSNTEPNG